ncbi:unnamed protein product [Amoebophrya sp. A120]|nr:unnamed protein product [Amoebophrya sp. A120]|eukprot:GSA120T00003006001.1
MLRRPVLRLSRQGLAHLRDRAFCSASVSSLKETVPVTEKTPPSSGTRVGGISGDAADTAPQDATLPNPKNESAPSKIFGATSAGRQDKRQSLESASSSSSAAVRCSGDQLSASSSRIKQRASYTQLRAPRTMQQRDRLQKTLHTGILSVDALAPLGQGGSMLCVHESDTNIAAFVEGLVNGCTSSGSVDEVVNYVFHCEHSTSNDAKLEKSVTVNECWQALAHAEAVAQDEGLDVLCVLDMGVFVEEWRSGQQRRAEKEEAILARTSHTAHTYVGKQAEAEAPWQDDLDPTAPTMTGTVASGDNAQTEAAAALTPSDEQMEPFALQSQKAEAPPESRRMFFAEVTERAANLRGEGTGSVSLLLVLNRSVHEANQVQELQSLTDGHLWLGTTGHPDRLDCRRSLTRFGLGSHQGHLQRSRILQKIAGHLRLNLASALDSSGSTTGGSAEDQTHQRLMTQVATALHTQDFKTSLSLEEEITLLLAASTHVFPDGKVLEGGKDSQFLKYTRTADQGRLLQLVAERGTENEGLSAGLAQQLAKNAEVFSRMHM